jgi:hypothetical protein
VTGARLRQRGKRSPARSSLQRRNLRAREILDLLEDDAAVGILEHLHQLLASAAHRLPARSF